MRWWRSSWRSHKQLWKRNEGVVQHFSSSEPPVEPEVEPGLQQGPSKGWDAHPGTPGDFLIPTGLKRSSGCESSEGVSLWEVISLMWSPPAISRERELNVGTVLREAGDGHLELSQERQE